MFRFSSPFVFCTQLWTASVTATPLFGMIPAEVMNSVFRGGTAASGGGVAGADVDGVMNAIKRSIEEQLGAIYSRSVGTSISGTGNSSSRTSLGADPIKFVGRMYHADGVSASAACIEYVYVLHTTKDALTAATLTSAAVAAAVETKWVTKPELEAFFSNELNVTVDAKFRVVATQLLKLLSDQNHWNNNKLQPQSVTDIDAAQVDSSSSSTNTNTVRILKAEASLQKLTLGEQEPMGDNRYEVRT